MQAAFALNAIRVNPGFWAVLCPYPMKAQEPTVCECPYGGRLPEPFRSHGPRSPGWLEKKKGLRFRETP